MSVRNAWIRVNDWIEELGRRRATDLITYGVAVYSMITGSILAFYPREPWIGPTYARALDVASPELWGGLMIACGAFTAIAFWGDGRAAKFPALSLTVLYGSLSILLAADPSGEAMGSPTASPGYTLAAYVSAVVVITCSGKAEK